MKNQRGIQGAKRLFFMQTGFVACLSLFASILFDKPVAYSVFLGGALWIIPQVIFAGFLFQDQRARFARHIVKRAYRGEAFKLITSAVLFAAVFRWIEVVPLVFFAGYMVVYSTSWFAPWFFKT